MKSVFEIKSNRIDVLSIVLKTQDMEAIKANLLEWFNKFADIRSMAFTIDVHELDDPWALHLAELIKFIKDNGLNLIGLQHNDKTYEALADKYGLSFSLIADLASDCKVHIEDSKAALIANNSLVERTVVIDKPIRSGQQVYIENADLIVNAMVSEGAEIIADGHIHVYAPMRGRAVAGASGDKDARIYIQSMQAQLISIAGIYRTFDQLLPEALNRKAVSVILQEDKLIIKALA